MSVAVDVATHCTLAWRLMAVNRPDEAAAMELAAAANAMPVPSAPTVVLTTSTVASSGFGNVNAADASLAASTLAARLISVVRSATLVAVVATSAESNTAESIATTADATTLVVVASTISVDTLALAVETTATEAVSGMPEFRVAKT